VFGYLGGGPPPFELKAPGNEFVLALHALPVVLVMSVLTTVLFYWGILPPIVRGIGFALERTLNLRRVDRAGRAGASRQCRARPRG